MSASRISPRARVDHRHADGAEGRLRHRLPAHRRMPQVGGVEVGVVGLDLDLQRILVADALERLVPFQDAGAHGLAVGERNGAVQPEHDRLLRLRQRRGRILLLQPPARDVTLDRRAGDVAGVVEGLGGEVAETIVGQARPHRRFRQRDQRIEEPEEQAADVGQRVGQRRHRRRHRRAGHERRRDLRTRQRVMRGHLEGREVGPHAGAIERRVAGVEGVGLPVGALERDRRRGQVGDEQRVGVDQDRLPLGVRLRGDRHRRDQAVGKARGDGARLGRSRLGRVLGVLRDQLDQRADLAELDDLRDPAG